MISYTFDYGTTTLWEVISFAWDGKGKGHGWGLGGLDVPQRTKRLSC